MRINLSIKERIILPLLVKEAIKLGNVIEMLNVLYIILKVSLTELEISDWGVSSDDEGNIKWDATRAIDKDFDITKELHSILVKAVKYFDDNKLVNLDNLFIIDKLLNLEFKDE